MGAHPGSGSGPQALVAQSFRLRRDGQVDEADELLADAVELADALDGDDRVATRLLLADAIAADAPDRAAVLLREAARLADETGDGFGAASAEARLGELALASDLDAGVALLRRAAAGFRAAGRPEGLVSVLQRLVELEPDLTAAEAAYIELRATARSGVLEYPLDIEAPASLAWGERLLLGGPVDDALAQLIVAFSDNVLGVIPAGVVAAGMRMNAALGAVDERWTRFPTGGQVDQLVEAGEVLLDPPEPGSLALVGWNFDPRQLPVTANRFPANERSSGWVLWTGEAPDREPGYVAVGVEELIRWVPQVQRYLDLPPGWMFEVAPDREAVWIDPELLDEE